MAKLLAGVFTVVLLSGPGNAGQGKPTSIQGVWRAVEVTLTGPAARTITFSERPNLTIFTARHYSRVEVQADGPRPIPADVTKASADELRAAWGPFVGEAGTYEVATGDLLTVRPIAAKNPAVMGPGVFITYSVQAGGRHDLGHATAKPEWPLPQSRHVQVGARRMTRSRREKLMVAIDR